MAYSTELAERVRAALAGGPPLREVRMFGGLAFMVAEKLAVGVGTGGDLLVRVDPERTEELLAVPGAREAEMGAGRAMGPGWIAVGEDAVGDDDRLGFWIETALEHNGARR